ncbi:MAG: orotate phosphoribosyltransferase [Ginsengibacter sp.]
MTLVTMQPDSKRTSTSKKIAGYLLDIGAVKFDVKKGFTWTSGIQSPIYCDNRIINSRIEVRRAVVDAFVEIIENKKTDQPDIIAGVATGGITYGVLAADKLSLPFIYVREKKKEHGMMKAVEGEYHTGDKVILVEDHISTGGSSLKAVEHLRDEGLSVICLISIMTYGFDKARDSFQQAGVEYESICDLDVVIDVAKEKGFINPSDIDTILKFRKSPKDWHPNV